MPDNSKIAADVLDAVGGKDNVTSVTHCMTRLRFTLKDSGIPDAKQIKRIDGVIGAQESGGQLQVIIGQNVPKVYDEVCRLGGFARKAAIDENLDADLQREPLTLKRVGNNILNYLSGSMVPMIPVLLCAGLFKTVAVVLGPTMLNVITEESDLSVLMNMLYNAGFYFLPIYLGYNAAKQIGLTPALGAFMGGILIEPTFVQMAADGASFSVYGIPCTPGSYAQTVAPILLSVFAMYYIERFFKRIMPDALTTIFTPFLTMVVAVPLTLCLLAPLGSWVGEALAYLFQAAGNAGYLVRVIATGLLCAVFLPVVITGMHTTFYMLAFATLATVGYDNFILVAFTIGLWPCYGMEFGSWLRMRDKHEKSQALGFFVSNIVGGVGEPFIYGMMFRYRRLFVVNTIAAFITGALAAALNVTVYVAGGSSNALNLVGFIGGDGNNFMMAVITAAIGFVVGAVLTYLFGFTEDELENGPVGERA